MSRRLLAAALALSAALTAPAREARAVVYSRVGDLVEIAQTSTLSFRGRVTAINFRSIAVNGLSRRQPYTEITFSVLTGFAGGLRAGQSFVLRQMGGRSAENPNLVQMIPGFPEFRLGVEYVVFTHDAKHPMEGARWGEAGVLRVAREADGTEIVLDARHRPLVSDGLGGMLPVRELRCAAFADAERACVSLISEAPHDVDDGDDGGLQAAGVAPDHIATKGDFDVFVRDAIRRRAPVGPALTNNLSRAAFEAALRQRLARPAL